MTPHTPRMTGTLIALILFALIAAIWSSARQAHELARQHAAQACRRSGTQLLDETVSLERLRPRRLHNGWLGLERQYRFDYSLHGDDRRTARLNMAGDRLLWIEEPEARGGLH